MKPSIVHSVVVFAAFVVGLAGCGAPEVPARVAAVADLPGNADRGASLYETHCQACHGADARSGSAGEDLVDEVGEEQDEVIETILQGKDGGAMPAFDEALSDQEIADILAYITSL